MSLLAAIFFDLALMAGMQMQASIYDAPVPDRCATFEKATAEQNREFCHAWRIEHRRRSSHHS